MKLTPEQARILLSDLPKWEIIDTTEMDGTTHRALHRIYRFKTFVAAFQFMNDSADAINSQDHHPRWENTYNRVEIWLSTHDSNNEITQRDAKLARTMEDIVASLGESL